MSRLVDLLVVLRVISNAERSKGLGSDVWDSEHVAHNARKVCKLL